MTKVFSEYSIAGITLKNRFIRSATHEGLADDAGNPTEKLIKKYEALAKGRVGAIITGYAGIMQNGKSPSFNMLMIDSEEKISSYKELTDRVHKLDTPIILQIAHCGRQTNSKITKMPTVAPSAIRDKLYTNDIPHELSESEIEDITERFASAVLWAKQAGFDGAQLHLAHGYLLSSFLSPHMNKRKDKWGGSTENRYRIIADIFEKARKLVGDYPILVKMNGYEKSEDGMNNEEAVIIAKLLEKSGCDAIEVSCGIAEEGFVSSRGSFPFEMLAECEEQVKKIPKILYPVMKPVLKSKFKSPEPHELYNLGCAEKIKKSVNIPVIVVGGIRKLNDMEKAVDEGKCDFISMCRPFIIEPDIVSKFSLGKSAESKCINCNFCLIGIEREPLRCYYGKAGLRDKR